MNIIKIIQQNFKINFVVLIMIFFVAFLEVSQLYIFQNLSNTLVDSGNINIYLTNIINTYFNSLTNKIGFAGVLSVFLCILAICTLFFGIILTYCKNLLIFTIRNQLTLKVYKNVLMKEASDFFKHEKTKTFMTVKEEPLRISNAVIKSLLELINQLILATFIITFGLIMIPKLILISLILFSIIGSLLYFGTKTFLLSSGKTYFEQVKGFYWDLMRSLGAFKETKVYELEDKFVARTKKKMYTISYIEIFKNTFAMSGKYILEGVAFITISLVIIIFFYFDLFTMDNFIASLALFAVTLLKLVPVFNTILGSYTTLVNTWYSVQIMNDALVPPKTSVIKNGIQLDEINHIRFDNVSYYHDKDNFVNNISFDLEKGKKYGFVGLSGSGKTTIIDILARLHMPSGGTYYINGIDIKKIVKSSILRKMGVVFQDNYIFRGSLKDNIIFMDDEIKDNKFILDIALKLGLDCLGNERKLLSTHISDDGSSISGGQKQRLGIARALYRNPDLLILDEATSALDMKSEREVMEFISGESKNRILLCIAHRISTLRKFDTIFVIKDGQIVSSGTYDYLFSSCDYFKEISA